MSLPLGGYLPHLPDTMQDTTAGSPARTLNETHKNPPMNESPISRRPTIISITSGEHSQRQRGSPSRGSSIQIEENSRLVPDICDSLMLSTFAKATSQRVPPTIPLTFDQDFRNSKGRWTRGALIIGRSAPMRIDEGIEVHLRSSANGEVDILI